MCSVSILEQEASQINTVTVTIVSVTVTETVKASVTLTTHVADNHGYAHSVGT